MSWVSLLLAIIGMVRQLTTYLHDQKLLDAGKAAAVAEALTHASKEIRAAAKIEEETTKKHKANPTDNAFDNEFQRK